MKYFIPILLALAVSACGKRQAAESAPASQPPAPSSGSAAVITSPSTSSSPGTTAAPGATFPSGTSAPPTTSGSSGADSSGSSAASAASGAAEGTYTVSKGDTLGGIAREHGVRYQDLAKWNNIKNPNMIEKGQELRLTAP